LSFFYHSILFLLLDSLLGVWQQSIVQFLCVMMQLACDLLLLLLLLLLSLRHAFNCNNKCMCVLVCVCWGPGKGSLANCLSEVCVLRHLI